MTLKTKDIVDKFADLPGEQRQGLATATGSDPGGDRGRRGGYAGEPDAGLRKRFKPRGTYCAA